MKAFLLAAAAVSFSLFAVPGFAQGLPPVKVIGVIAAIDGDSLTVTEEDGSTVEMLLVPTTFVAQTEPIAIADIPVGSFVGTAALPGDENGLAGLELHVFPESMRGAGAGFTPWDSGPDSTMSNGTLSNIVMGTTASTITVTYDGGEQTVVIDEGTPVVTFNPADRTVLTVGANVIARGANDDAGVLGIAFIVVGKDGSVPPV